jgi:hypothetical protein
VKTVSKFSEAVLARKMERLNEEAQENRTGHEQDEDDVMLNEVMQDQNPEESAESWGTESKDLGEGRHPKWPLAKILVSMIKKVEKVEQEKVKRDYNRLAQEEMEYVTSMKPSFELAATAF